MAVLGCGTGNGLDVVDPARTRRFVGVDLNADYLALARRRHARLDSVATWIHADVGACPLEPARLDLIHAALLFEYADPGPLLPLIAGWLAPGGVLSVVLQLPGGDAPISQTGFASLHALTDLMALIPPDRFRDLAARAGLTETSSRQIPLARGKSFWAATFER
jgi:SAM-dependent methyltransferase